MQNDGTTTFPTQSRVWLLMDNLGECLAKSHQDKTKLCDVVLHPIDYVNWGRLTYFLLRSQQEEERAKDNNGAFRGRELDNDPQHTVPQ